MYHGNSIRLLAGKSHSVAFDAQLTSNQAIVTQSSPSPWLSGELHLPIVVPCSPWTANSPPTGLEYPSLHARHNSSQMAK